MEFTGPVDHPLLCASVSHVLARHPALRSRFRLNIDDRQVEYRTDGEPADTEFLDAQAEQWPPDELGRVVGMLCYTPFDLGGEPPVRATVIRVDATRTLLVLTVHHIVCDGWSRTLLMAEIAETYRALAAGTEPPGTEPAHPSDVVTMAGPDEVAERLPAILDRLRGAPMGVDFPFARATREPGLSGASASITFDTDLTQALLATARQEGCTPFMTAVVLLAGTLAGRGKQRDFLFAFGWPGRDDPAVAGAVGMFMSTAVVRVRLDDTTTWREFLRHTRTAALEAFMDADVPLDALTAGLRPNRDVIWPPLTPVLVNMMEVPADMELAPGVAGRLRPLPALHMKYDFGLFVNVADGPDGSRLTLSVDYVEALYDGDAISAFLAQLRRSATLLAHRTEDMVTDSPATETDLSTQQGRLEFVRSLWLEILKLDEVDDDVSFFDVGGDSLLLIMLVERMSQATDRGIRTMDLFRAGTVRGHAELLAAR